jgi:tetratricopeptide (TPR) repeat protein
MPDAADEWRAKSRALLAAGRAQEAEVLLRGIVAHAPEQADAHLLLRDALAATGQQAEAFLAGIAGQALEQRSAHALFQLGTIHFLNRRAEDAARWYALAAQIDSEATVLWHRNLSVNLWGQGQFAAAAYHRERAFSRQCLFVEGVRDAAIAVLVLCNGARGDVPVDDLFADMPCTLLKWVIEYAPIGQENALPHFDLVFNAIGDPDLSAPVAPRVAAFLRACGKPVLNAPEQVTQTVRHEVSHLLRGIENIVVPKATRVAALRLRDFVQMSGDISFPLLLRPAGSHGGEFLVKLEEGAALAEAAPVSAEVYYVSAFHDYRSPDGYYRKYRVAFVDRQPYAYHLAISEHWMVHYETADMADHAWKLAEELRFIGNPEQALGQRALATIAAIGYRANLDFCGMDFSVLEDGRVLVFEVNPAMLIHPEPQGSAKNSYIQRIYTAFASMVQERLRRDT